MNNPTRSAQWLRTLCLACLSYVLAACGAIHVDIEPIPSRVTARTEPPPAGATSEVTPLVDIPPRLLPDWSYWMIRAAVWHDRNADGQMDEGEPPMEGVRIVIDDNLVLATDEAGATSASLLVGTDVWDRESETFTIRVDPPRGYSPTTPVSLELQGGAEVAILFGLQHDPSLGEPTPRPRRSLDCRDVSSFLEGFGELGMMGMTADGTVLASLVTHREGEGWASGRLFRFDSEHGTWIEHLSSVEFNLHWVAGLSPDDFWAGGYPLGIYHYQSGAWKRYTGEDSLGGGKFEDFALDPIGTAWAPGDRHVYYLPPGASHWSSMPTIETPSFDWVRGVELDKDGSLWVVADPIVHITHSPQAELGFAFELYDVIPQMPKDVALQDYDMVDSQSSLTTDGSLWFWRNVLTGSMEKNPRLFRFNTAQGTLQEYNYDTTGGAMLPFPVIAFRSAQDDSIWAMFSQPFESGQSDAHPLVHFIPGAAPTEGHWIVHHDENLPGLGSLQLVDKAGGVWISEPGDQAAAKPTQLVRCEER